MRFRLLLLAVLTSLITPLTSAAPASAAPPLRVAVYGDSIAVELKPYLLLFGAKANMQFDWNVFGGTNACDFLAEARRDASSSSPPQVVVTLFTGNSFTSCMRPQGKTLSQPEVAWKTAADSNALAALFPRATVYRVGYARTQTDQRALDAGGFSRVDTVNYLLAASAAGRRDWRYVDGSTPLLNAGRYTDMLPCGIFDTALSDCSPGGPGRVRVRALDGVHLCPVAKDAAAGVLPLCPAFSSGAVRLAAVVYTAVKP